MCVCVCVRERERERKREREREREREVVDTQKRFTLMIINCEGSKPSPLMTIAIDNLRNRHAPLPHAWGCITSGVNYIDLDLHSMSHRSES